MINFVYYPIWLFGPSMVERHLIGAFKHRYSISVTVALGTTVKLAAALLIVGALVGMIINVMSVPNVACAFCLLV